MLRSAKRYKALDETGVFGYCCRHEFPQKFISLKHGERYVVNVTSVNSIHQLVDNFSKDLIFPIVL